ncbi:response regulator [Pseudoponticoccus marisrubri]|uniref:Response regulatory domain-containing protein n=1 Tax=Pseudoponticoccus marisrubri TaxID=1685382 RepID=A0A0W7WMG9_9RHOB|nr:response regulator [Pseudoponticoccus marisrubri]KUF11789.1 hypothetical protein AVJ23_04175 [Pseudoponticoccus marisrubri]
MTQIIQAPKAQSPGRSDRLTVMVLEDDEVDRIRLIKLCRRAGLEAAFHCAADLGEFQVQLDARPFDLVFIDYHLGLSTGQEALDLLQTHPEQQDAISIMVTSVDAPDVIIRAMRSGCVDYLIKEELCVETIRKSVFTAFQKTLLQSTRDIDRLRAIALEEMLTRFRDSMEPEMRRIMSAMLWRIRSLGKVNGQTQRHVHRRELENLCLDLISFLDRSETLLGKPDLEVFMSAQSAAGEVR